jgi:hypothetical protein
MLLCPMYDLSSSRRKEKRERRAPPASCMSLLPMMLEDQMNGRTDCREIEKLGL